MSTPFEVLNIDKIEPGWAKYSRMRRDKFQLLKYTLQNLIKKKPRYLTPDTHTPVPSTRYQNMISPYYFKAKSLYASVLMICLKLLLSHILNYMLPIQVICIEFVYLPLCNLILIQPLHVHRLFFTLIFLCDSCQTWKIFYFQNYLCLLIFF